MQYLRISEHRNGDEPTPDVEAGHKLRITAVARPLLSKTLLLLLLEQQHSASCVASSMRRRVTSDQVCHAVEHHGDDDGEPEQAKDHLHEALLLEVQAGQGDDDHRKEEHAQPVQRQTAFLWWGHTVVELGIAALVEGGGAEGKVCGPG